MVVFSPVKTQRHVSFHNHASESPSGTVDHLRWFVLLFTPVMRGLLKAGVLLAPVLAGAVALEEGESSAIRPSQEDALINQGEDSIPSAFITLHLPESDDAVSGQDVVFRFDIHESSDACGYGNVSINGQQLPEGGSGSFTVNDDRVMDATWNLTCVAWNDKPQEQLLSLNVGSVSGQDVEDVGFTIRFQQVAPVWISDVEGTASMTRVHSINQAKPDCDDELLDVEAEMAELHSLKWQVAELKQQIFAKERRLADALGWPQRPRPPMIEECDSLKCVFGALFHKVKGAAWSIYGGGDFSGFDGMRHHEGPPGANHFREHHHPHGPPPFGHSGHHNHTKNGTDHHHHHPPPFAHPPPFCKCPPPPPPPPGHHGPPSHGPPPPPPPPPAGAWPPPPPGAFPPHHPHGDFSPPSAHSGSWSQSPPPGPPHDPHGPPHGSPHGPPHGPPEGPGPMSGHHGMESGEPFSHHPADHHRHGSKPHHMPRPGGEHNPWDEDEEEDVPEVKTEQAPKDAHMNGEEPSEAELRRDFEHRPHHEGPPPPHMHDGPDGFLPPPHHHEGPPRPHMHDGPDGSMPPPPPHHDGPDGFLPPPPPHHHDGPPPPHMHDGPDGSMPPPPPPHHGGPPGPHPPIFIHIASAISSLILLGVFISVLYQRYVRRNSVIYLSSHRRRRGYSNAPWYKKLCFGPNYSDIAEDEKEAMLRDCDSDCSSVEGDEDVVSRDISQFRNVAEVGSEMVAAEEGRMMMPASHSRHSSSEFGQMQMPVPPMHSRQASLIQVPQLQQMQLPLPQAYMPTNAIPIPMMNTVPVPISAEAAAMFPDLHHDDVMDELPAYQEANSSDDDDASELASSLAADGYRPGCSGSYTPSDSGSQGASDILGDTKN